MALDDKVRAYLRELGAALNEAVSSSEKVHELLAKVKAGRLTVDDATARLKDLPFAERLANAPLAVSAYLGKTRLIDNIELTL